MLLRNSLILFLTLNMTGALPAVTALVREAAADPTPSFNMRASSAQASQIDDQLKLLVRRARHPGTPGTPGGIPTQSDVDQVEGLFNDWKSGLEHALSLPNAPATRGSVEYLPTDAKLRAVNKYFNELSLLATLRIALGLEHGRGWSDRFALHIPKSVMTDFPGLGAPAQDRLGGRFLPLVIDRGDDGQADPVSLRVSETLVQGLEIGRLSDNPNEANFLTMVQYLAVRQLLQNLSDLRYLKQDHNVELPQIPAQLRGKLETMGMLDSIDDEHRRAVAEPGARQALATQVTSILGQVPAFVTDELVNQMADAAQLPRNERADLKSTLQQAESDNIAAAVQQEVAASSLPLSSMKAEEMIPTLRYFLANAKTNTLLDKFLHMVADGVIDLSQDQRAQIMTLLDTRKAAFSASLPEAALRSWFTAARHASEDELYTQRRNQFTEDLLLHAPEVAQQVQQTYAGQTIDPSVLARSFAQDLARMAPRDSVKDWLYDVTHVQSYAAARDRYSQKIQGLTSPRVLVNGVIDPARVQLYVDSHDFRPDIHFSPDVNPVLAQRLIDRVTQGRKNDITNFLQIGDWLGFNRVYSQSAPTVVDILTDEAQRGKYFEGLTQETLSQYPVLATEVPVTTADGGSSSDHLYDALTALNPNFQSSQDVMDRAQLLIDQALIQIESKIRQDIETVAQASDLHDIEKVVQSSMMLTLVMRGFPEFRVSQDRFVEDLLEPSLTHQIMHRYVGNYLTWGFGALMLMHIGAKVFKKAGPFVEAITDAFEPMIQGYMRTAIIVGLADTAYQAHELYEVRERRQQTEDFFFSNAAGHSFFEYGELQAANSSYQWSKWMFVGRVAMDTLFMYLPMLRGGARALTGVLTRKGDMIALNEFFGDVKAFQNLRLEPGKWDGLDSAIADIRTHADAMDPDDLADAERAYVRLSDKLRAGDDWDLASIRSGEDLSAAEKRIRAALQRRGLMRPNGAMTSVSAGSHGSGTQPAAPAAAAGGGSQ